ncbi:MAG: ferrous iron transporter B [Bacteriovoracaceae bacterium]|nr:ferrous iron transporter B [Bacteriovoracaceae bacterium]
MLKKHIAIVGAPNGGKSSLFNILTGANQRVGNFPGITVEKKTGIYSDADVEIEFIDLPGLYSLDTRTLDERISKNVILHKELTAKPLDGIVVVVDSTNLEKSLYLLFELMALEIPTVVALNLWDLAEKRNQKIDLIIFQELLAVPVVPTSAKDKLGITDLIEVIKKLPPHNNYLKNIDPQHFRKLDNIKENFSKIDSILQKSVIRKIDSDSLTEKLDKIFLNPYIGPVVLVIVLALMFQAIFEWSSPLSDLIEQGVGFIVELIHVHVSNELLASLLADGIISGVGSVFVFLPQIILLFLLILILEDVGYLGRAALMMDGIMRRLGLPGKAVVPLLSSHACSIPGIMAARTIDNDKERLITMLVAPVTTCSARIPVFTLLIASIFPDVKVLGFLNVRGLAMLGMYVFSMLSSLLIAFVLKRTVITGSISHLLLELPGYRIPSIKSVFLSILLRVKIFTKKAGTIILALSIVIWFLVTFPRNQNGEVLIENSYAASIGKVFTPVFAPIGFDWRLTTALIPSMGAREVVVSTLATVLAVDGEEGDGEFEKNFTTKVVENFGIPSLLSLLVWFVFAPQCIAMIATFRRESGSKKWTMFMMGYTFTLAYVGSFIVYRLSLWLI